MIRDSLPARSQDRVRDRIPRRFEGLRDLHSSAPLQTQNCQQCLSICFMNFPDVCQNLANVPKLLSSLHHFETSCFKYFQKPAAQRAQGDAALRAESSVQYIRIVI